MTLGDFETSLADGMYDPTMDRATLKDGSVVEHYYRDKLGVKYFQSPRIVRTPNTVAVSLPPVAWNFTVTFFLSLINSAGRLYSTSKKRLQCES